MTRSEFVNAVMSAAGTGELSPVQVQKLFFILDEEVLSNPCFAFRPYNYGPFDPDVYREIESLAEDGLAKITVGDFQHRIYRLTDQGVKSGQLKMQDAPEWVQTFIAELVEWIIPLSFDEIVAYIYEHYPHMKENSVFQNRQ